MQSEQLVSKLENAAASFKNISEFMCWGTLWVLLKMSATFTNIFIKCRSLKEYHGKLSDAEIYLLYKIPFDKSDINKFSQSWEEFFQSLNRANQAVDSITGMIPNILHNVLISTTYKLLIDNVAKQMTAAQRSALVREGSSLSEDDISRVAEFSQQYTEQFIDSNIIAILQTVPPMNIAKESLQRGTSYKFNRLRFDEQHRRFRETAILTRAPASRFLNLYKSLTILNAHINFDVVFERANVLKLNLLQEPDDTIFYLALMEIPNNEATAFVRIMADLVKTIRCDEQDTDD